MKALLIAGTLKEVFQETLNQEGPLDKYEMLETRKAPVNRHKHLGIEIEFVSESDREEILELLIEQELETCCELGDDGSIDPMKRETIYEDRYQDSTGTWVEESYADYDEYGEGYELRVLCTESNLAVVMSRVGAVLSGCKAEVNNSCGLHVHLDMRHRDVVAATKKLLRKQDQMFKMVPPSRKENTYCQKVYLSSKNVPLAINKALHIPRHSDINITEANAYNKTIEVRLHEGTTNTRAIINWCKYLISIVNKKKQPKGVVEYAKKRIKEYSSRAG